MKNIIIKKIVFAILISVLPAFAYAQHTQELSVWAGGGITNLKTKTSDHISDKKTGIGGSFGIGYTYFVSSNVGIQTGIEYSIYNSKLQISDLGNKYITGDNEKENFEYRYKISGMEEKRHAGMIQIPLMVQYQIPVFSANMFYVSGGGKVGFPVSKTYKQSIDKLETEGYYPETKWTVNDMEEQGFGTFESLKSDGDLDLKVSFILSAETGLKWALSDKYYLYTGLYLDYGLNDINNVKNPDNLLIAYNSKNPSLPVSRNFSKAVFKDDTGALTPVIKKIHPIAYGIKVRFSFGL